MKKRKFRKRKFAGFFMSSGIIDIEVLTWYDRIFLSYVISFTKHGQEFYASNAYITEVLKMSKASIANSIKRLSRLGWLELPVIEDGVRYLKATDKSLTVYQMGLKKMLPPAHEIDPE